jgi:hypothetical protein
MKRRGTLTVGCWQGSRHSLPCSPARAVPNSRVTDAHVPRAQQPGNVPFHRHPTEINKAGRAECLSRRLVLWTSPLYDAANERRQGKRFFKCVAVTRSKRFGGSTFLCDATFSFANGTLVIGATFKGNKPPAGPVIGGAGAYEGASGVFTSVERRRTTVDTLHFDTD